MGGGKSKKRKLAQYAEDLDRVESTTGVGAMLAHIRCQPAQEGAAEEHKPDAGEWTTVGKGGKKQKMANYPAISYSELHRIKQSVNINSLQSLVLYCLADGTSPQFVSVRHHGMVKKAVVLLVPGLEMGMFNGGIKLDAPEAAPPGAESPNFINESMANGKESSADVADQIATNEDTNTYNIKPPPKSPDDYLPLQLAPDNLPIPLKPVAECFSHVWPVKAPGEERNGKVHSPLHAMLNSPITKTQEEKREDKLSKGPKPAREGKNWENRRTPITSFVSVKEELQENDFTLHPVYWTTPAEKEKDLQQRLTEKKTLNDGWVDTPVDNVDSGTISDDRIEKDSLTAGHSILAMDCEMCLVEGGVMALTRISLVKWDGSILLDEFVKPDKPIIDYLTTYSGITPSKLENVTTNLKDIQSRLLKEITPYHILVGHSLNSDLAALKLTHPFVVDTSILYPHPRGPPMKSSLKWLAQKYLGREIQKGHGNVGHDSVEDAIACLDLVKMKCERGPQWGTSEATVESIFKRLKRSSKNGTSAPSSSGRTGAIIDHGAPEKNFGSMASYCIGCTEDAGVVRSVKRTVLGDEDGRYIPGGGVDFTWARFQELATIRGWLNDHRYSSNGVSQKPTDVDPSPKDLAEAVTKTVNNIKAIRDFLPPCTLFIVYTGTGDPRAMARLQVMHRTYKREYLTKKWDDLSIKWTDTEEQGLKAACQKARGGLGFVTIV